MIMKLNENMIHMKPEKLYNYGVNDASNLLYYKRLFTLSTFKIYFMHLKLRIEKMLGRKKYCLIRTVRHKICY